MRRASCSSHCGTSSNPDSSQTKKTGGCLAQPPVFILVTVTITPKLRICTGGLKCHNLGVMVTVTKTLGWKRLIPDANQFRGEGNYPILAYSEFMPPPRVGFYPYGGRSADLFMEDDPWGWPVSEYEQSFELTPGIQSIAGQALKSLVHLGRGETAHGISGKKLEDNPCWPEELRSRAGALHHERYVLLFPLALSRT